MSIYTKKRKTHKEMYASSYSLQHYLQWPVYGNNLSVHQWMNQQRRYGIQTMEYRSAIRKKEILPFATT